MISPNSPIDFTPATTTRHDGWTAERQREFIIALSEMGCVSDACAAVGISPRSAYRLRRRPGAEAFDRAWDNALRVAARRLVTLAFERAVHGTVREVRWKGEVVGEERVPSDRLLMFLLRHLDPMRFGNLTGVLPYDIQDPRVVAGQQLARALKAFSDLDEPAQVADSGKPREDAGAVGEA